MRSLFAIVALAIGCGPPAGPAPRALAPAPPAPPQPDPAPRPEPRRPAPAPRPTLAFWLVADDTWRSTFYWESAGRLQEGETVTTTGAPDREPTGTLRFVSGCRGDRECRVSITCPFAGPLVAPLGEVGGCRPLSFRVASACSDQTTRILAVTLDGNCHSERGPRASILVEGEVVSDGVIPGWQPVVEARYLWCGSAAGCRSDLAAASPGSEVFAAQCADARDRGIVAAWVGVFASSGLPWSSRRSPPAAAPSWRRSIVETARAAPAAWAE